MTGIHRNRKCGDCKTTRGMIDRRVTGCLLICRSCGGHIDCVTGGGIALPETGLRHRRRDCVTGDRIASPEAGLAPGFGLALELGVALGVAVGVVPGLALSRELCMASNNTREVYLLSEV